MSTRRARPFALPCALTALCLIAGIGSSASARQDGDTTYLDLGTTPAGHPTVIINVGDHGPYSFVLDTGASHTAIALPMAEEVGYQPESNLLPDRGTRITFNTRGVEHARPTGTRAVTLRNLRVGGACLDVVPALFANLDIFRSLGWLEGPAIILGMDSLENLNLIVDRDSGIVELSPTSEETSCRRDRVQFSGVLTPSMP